MITDTGRPLRRSRLGQTVFYLWGIFTSGAVVAIFFAVWQLASQHLGTLILPEPLFVLRRMWQLLGDYPNSQISITLWRTFIGLTIALSGGICLGLLAGCFKSLAIFCRPIISILLGMPPIIWVVLALFWFGMTSSGTIFTIVVVVLPFTFAAAMRGIISIDKGLEEMLTVYQISYYKQLHTLYIPHLLNHLLPAITVAIGTGVKVAIMAELLSTNTGIGAQLAQARAMLDTETVLAYVLIILSIIFIVEYLIVEPLKILIMPWEN